MVSAPLVKYKTTNRCPCCNALVDTDKILVDLNTNAISYGGQTAIVNAKTAEMAAVLAAGSPNAVGFDALISGMWGAFGKRKNKRKLLGSYALFLRNAIRPLRLELYCIRGLGYRLVEAQEERGVA